MCKKKKNNVEIVAVCHFILIYVYFYELFPVENCLILPAVIPLSYRITESMQQNEFDSLETPHALHMDENFSMIHSLV